MLPSDVTSHWQTTQVVLPLKESFPFCPKYCHALKLESRLSIDNMDTFQILKSKDSLNRDD